MDDEQSNSHQSNRNNSSLIFFHSGLIKSFRLVYNPTATEILDVTVDGTPVSSDDYTVSGDEIIFDNAIAASSQIEIDHITGSTTYDLTTPGTPDALDPIGGFTGMMTNFNLYNDMMAFTPGNNNYLTVTQNGTELVLDTDYTIDGAQIGTFIIVPGVVSILAYSKFPLTHLGTITGSSHTLSNPSASNSSFPQLTALSAFNDPDKRPPI